MGNGVESKIAIIRVLLMSSDCTISAAKYVGCGGVYSLNSKKESRARVNWVGGIHLVLGNEEGI